MTNLGPAYPFDPLPPPEHPSMRNMTRCVQRRNNQPDEIISNKSQNTNIHKTDFHKVLKKKAEGIEKITGTGDTQKKLREVAEDLEAFFVYSILKGFHSASFKGGLFDESAGSKMFMDMFFENVATEVAHSRGGLGLSELIIDSLQDSIRQTDSE